MNNPSSASVTFTFGFSSVTTNTVQATQAVIGEFSGVATTSADAGIGNTVLSTGSSLSIATTGSVPQTNDLVVSSVRNSASNPTSFGGSQIDFVNDPAKLATYQITTSGTITHTYTYGGSNQISATIAAFKHP
jgi:hypothetical protein